VDFAKRIATDQIVLRIERIMIMNKEFKVGDEVMYNNKKWTIIYEWKNNWEIDDGTCSISVSGKDLTHYVESPTVKNQFVDRTNDLIRQAIGQTEFCFDELTGEDESWNMEYFAEGGIEKPRALKGSDSDLYCSCSIPEIIKNQAYGNSFLYCKGCRKERI